MEKESCHGKGNELGSTRWPTTRDPLTVTVETLHESRASGESSPYEHGLPAPYPLNVDSAISVHIHRLLNPPVPRVRPGHSSNTHFQPATKTGLFVGPDSSGLGLRCLGLPDY
ncbi:hypothetical protein SMACR_09478 [Sordaria macrospora]|uniref:WGS project CABT00000000 data, contig 2.62 n=2 Tax=Sordaria macrospora TaxID=5147 RepID=F7WAK6_SORMK|nr:uncharacterized protein SMAC_09478 [Sordaria macrospora k-hell]KAA8623930.1 hypothetical protein SMACR_09478 [Sordaria macrospora]KAH7625416.1 hypothetical protein B0T09DRAFT_315454 [Sordaria sp. MPI-SDFR-AT-0083]WPJ62607.1 hypothetical protein SMAC4_09478 [Sordaria macrospora]CCC14200.1 unnamed protein product [Sordaria macrospora k-hell]